MLYEQYGAYNTYFCSRTNTDFKSVKDGENTDYDLYFLTHPFEYFFSFKNRVALPPSMVFQFAEILPFFLYTNKICW